MGARAKRAPGIDHEVQRGRSRGLPRRSHRQPVTKHQRSMELPPALGPVIGDLAASNLDQRAGSGRSEVRQLRELTRGAVDGELHDVRVDLGLLEPARRQLQELGQHQLGIFPAHPDRKPQQWSRSARLSRRRRV